MAEHGSFLKALQDFAKYITQNFAIQIDAQPEDQLKPAVTNLLISIGQQTQKQVKVRTEAHPHDVNGRPDLGVAISNLLCGFVELKAPGLGSNPSKLKGDQNKKQWENFKSIPNLIYTDGNEWSLYRTGKQVGPTIKFDGDITEDGITAVSPENANSLNVLLQDFLSWEPLVPHGPRELAQYLAPLTRFLRQEVELSLKDEGSAISLLAKEWRSYLFPEADNHQFTDAYAQSLTYALLLARISGAKDLSPETAATVLDKGNGLLATTLRILAHQEARQEVSVGYGMLERSLVALDPAKILKRAPDLWLYFYEDFLAAYDPKLRNDYGVYYTPVQVVRCQIRLVSELLRMTFGKKLSFADEGVTFLDPAVGTGTYLVSAMHHALNIVREHSGLGSVAGRASLMAKNMYAFEVLVGPYAVAHLRLTQEILSEGGSLPSGRLQVYLADTLESPFTTPTGSLDLAHKPLVEERKRARAVKDKLNILVCIGNPPYDRQTIEADDTVTQRKGGWVRFGDQGQQGSPIFEDFLEPARKAGNGVHLKNIYNDYAYFWRWALWKLFEHQNTGGIVSFVTASSYLAGPGFVGMREVMRKTFDKLWIINLEGDNLGARKTENVFNIQTPVAIAIGICKGKSNRDSPATVQYTKLTGTRLEKLETLNGIEAFAHLKWQNCRTGWQDTFLPAGTGDYFSWPSLTDVFPWQHSGAQFKRRWPIGVTQEVLHDRWVSFLSLDAPSRRHAFYETRDRKVKKVYSNTLPGADQISLKDLHANADMPVPLRYAYRSFDRQWVLFDTRLGDYLRPQSFSAHSNQQLYMHSLLTKQLGNGPSSVITSDIPDLDVFCARGAKDIIPLWRDAGATQSNITKGFLDVITKGLKQTVAPEDIYSYCYAVLAPPAYVSTFWEELSTPGPRIPITKDAELFNKGVEAGRRLIWLHTNGERMVPSGQFPGELPTGKAKCQKAIPETEIDYPEDFSYEPITKELRYGAGRFGPVDQEIWDFQVSGLEVVKSWLSYRRKSGAGKSSSPLDEIRPRRWTAQMTEEFLELLWVLEHTTAMFSPLQKLLEQIVAGPCFLASELPTPSPAQREAPQEVGEKDDLHSGEGKLLSGIEQIAFAGATGVEEKAKGGSSMKNKKSNKKPA